MIWIVTKQATVIFLKYQDWFVLAKGLQRLLYPCIIKEKSCYPRKTLNDSILGIMKRVQLLVHRNKRTSEMLFQRINIYQRR